MSASRRWRIARRSARPPKHEYTHKKQTGGSGQYAHVKLRVEPLPGQASSSSSTRFTAASIPKEFITAVEKGIAEALEGGVLAGYPDVQHQGRRVSTAAITTSTRRKWRSRSAGSICVKEACRKAKPVLLEPVMRSKWWSGRVHGSVIGDLISRRGRIEGTEIAGRHADHQVDGSAVEMFGYATELRSRTQGRGSFHDALRPVRRSAAQSIAEEIVSKVQGKV